MQVDSTIVGEASSYLCILYTSLYTIYFIDYEIYQSPTANITYWPARRYHPHLETDDLWYIVGVILLDKGGQLRDEGAPGLDNLEGQRSVSVWVPPHCVQ